MAKALPKVVVIGGGTGSFVLLSSLKTKPVDITALVNMVDDGGSTGILRDELGVLPPGDIRQCLVALSQASDELRELFNFRFPTGGMAGHSFGNIFLSAVESMTTDFTDAVKIAGDVLQISGRVLPVTLDNCHLVLEQGTQVISGQNAISDTLLTERPPKLTLKPSAQLLPEARRAIRQADLIVIAPGLLYGSLIPSLLVEGMAQALQTSQAPLVYVSNLVNKPGQTDNFTVADYATEIERFIGPGSLNHVIYNSDPLPPALLKKYALDGETPVAAPAAELAQASYQARPLKCLSHQGVARNPSDTLLQRSLIRHDGEAVAAELLRILEEQ